jgi:diguanylate cyclase (GGDEF)-like protein
MRAGVPELYEKILIWSIPIAAGAHAAWLVWLARADLAASWLLGAALCAAAALAAGISASGGPSRSVRLALSFVLAGMLLLPAPGSVLICLAACLAGRGAGIAGPPRRGVAMIGALLVSVTIAQFVRMLGLPDPDPSSPATLLYLGVLFAVVQVSAYGIYAALHLGRTPALEVGRPLPMVLVEAINVLLAWVLFDVFAHGGWLPGAGLSAVLVLGAYALRKLDRAHEELKQSNTALAARVSELATLHSIGREILSSLDPSRVFSIVERECRKIFDVDFFFIALREAATNTLQVVYRERATESAKEVTRPLGKGLASWVVAEKRGIRVDDFHDPETRLPFQAEVVDREIRSALAVPLTVEERVIGVLSVQSRRPGAYDDHLLSVLTTIAQQAAVAIENARHYEMATVDSLTRLFLRDYFFRRLEEEHNRARRYGGTFALLMMDLDSFKEINDHHGHLAGDRYLRALGATIHNRLRAADLACRYGGDEFCLLLPETDVDGASAFAERIRTAVSDLVVEIEGLSLRTTISIGVALFPDHEAGELKALLLRADQALYEAKREGRDRVVLYAARTKRGSPARAHG